MYWQPIETAPINTEVQTWCRVYDWRPHCRLIQRGDGKSQWQEWGDNGFERMDWVRMEHAPIAWAPQPTAPKL
jgi:hypothetical protein